ncbi:MAG: hypothetical protein EOM12_15200 [Verrucomicrobiae bacterium]|nr:hypothetical protein [Verrucomicrobiae bacterium]
MLALKLTNVFLMGDPEKEYLEAFSKAQEQDWLASQHGTPSRKMTEYFLSQGIFPENLWQELKKNSDGYELLLELLSMEDREFLEAFIQYPNGASFLINTGKAGIRLIEESEGEVLALSCFLPHEEIRALPELCSRYPQLPKVLRASGFESYFVVMIDPDFFFDLAQAISGSDESRYLLAHAVISRQIESGKDPQDLGNFLGSLSRDEKDRLAFYVADFINSIDGSMEDEDGAIPLAPLVDPYFFKFVHKYGDRAVRLSQSLGDLISLGQIMLEDWQGEVRDVTPVLDAIQDFDDNQMGLQAALEFRFNRRMQDIILGPIPGGRRRDALMFLFYADSMGLSKNMGDWEKITKKLIAENKAEVGTGRPIPKDGGQSFVEFVPGHDVIKVIQDAVVYGQSPTIGALAFAALDVVEIVPLAWGTTTIVKNVAKQGIKASCFRYARQSVGKSTRALLNKATGALDDVARPFKKMSIPDLRRGGRSLIRGVQNLPGLVGNGVLHAKDASAILINSLSSFKVQDLSSFLSKIGDLAKASGRTVRNIYRQEKYYLTGLYSRPWKVKHATEAVIDGVLSEMLLQPTVFYFGALGITDLIEDRNELLLLIRNRQENRANY